MTLEDLAPTAPTTPSSTPRDLSRRTVVAAAAWSVPAVSLASATPAFANTSQASNMTIAGPSGGVPASGTVPMTVTVKDAQGQPQAGQPVSFSGPDGSSFDSADGVTNGAGQYTANFNYNKPWATPGATITVTAVSGSGNATQSFTLLGANAMGFGYNAWTELGDGGAEGGGDANSAGVSRTVPSQLLRSFPAPITQVISCGSGVFGGWAQSTLVLLADGTVWGVGGNGAGQLGDGTYTPRATWAQIPNLSGVTQLATGNETVYALLGNKTAVAWGDNFAGQLGAGSTAGNSNVPLAVASLANIRQVSGGTQQVYFLLEDGTVWAAGRNTFAAALGNGSSVDHSSVPVQVSNLTDVVQIHGYAQGGYALKSDGTVWAWGSDYGGALGKGTTPVPPQWSSGAPNYSSSTPVQVQGLSGKTVLEIAGNFSGGLALCSDGSVFAWGDNTNGFVGDGTTTSKSSATQVSGLTSGVVQIAASGNSAYALKSDGAVVAWGSNAHGQLGTGDTTDALVPGVVQGLAGLNVSSLMRYAPSPQRMFLVTGELTVSVDVIEDQISAGSAGTVRATVSSGSTDIAGAEVSLTATGNAVLGSTLGQTNGNGEFVTTVVPDQWTTPGTQITVRASTDAAVSSDSVTVLGANVLGAGTNRWGSLGTDDSNWTLTNAWPVQLWKVFDSPVVQMASNSGSALALLADGTVWGIGQNAYLEVSGTATNISSWTQVPGVANAKQIVIGDYSSAALLRDGSVMAWGSGPYGQLGDGSGGSAVWTTPRKIQELGNDVTAIAAGWGTVYALMSDATVRACGWGELGQIGDGRGVNVTSFTTVPNLTGIDKIVTYPGCCVARKASDGSLWFWGYDGAPTGYVLSPTAVPNMTGVKDFSPTLAVMNDGSVYQYSRLTTPILVSGLTNPVVIASNEFHQYVVLADGTLRSWGRNANGELGDGTANTQTTPVPVQNMTGLNVSSIWPSIRDNKVFFVTGSTSVTVDVTDSKVTAGVASAVSAKVAAGSKAVPGASVTLSATDNAALGASTGTTNASGVFQTTVTPDLWTTPGEVVRVEAVSGPSSAQDTFQVVGANVAGQGAGFNGNNQAVVLVDRVFPSPVVQITSACGDWYGDAWWMALLADGTVWTRGYDNSFNKMAGGGSGDNSLTWGKVPSLANVKQIATMYGSGFALLASGKVLAWGANWQGQLGTGSTNEPSSPVEIPNLSNVAAVTVGDRTGYALLTDGTVKAWGQNDSGEVGNGTFTNPILTPQPVSNLSNVVQLAATRHTGVALLGDGTVWSWGNNSTAVPASNNSAFGLVGDGSTQNQSTPVKLTSLSGVTQISGGGYAAYALMPDKTVQAWGTNVNGSVGDGTTTNRPTPVPVSGLSGVVKVSALDANGYALLSDGTVKAWGQNNWGQLCDGSTTTRLAPVTATSAMNGHPVVDLPVRSPRGVYSGFFVYGTATVSLDVATSMSAGATGAVTAKVTAGSTPVVGAAISLAASGGAVLAATSGQSDSSGALQTTVTPDAWTRPGASLSVTAASGSSSTTRRYVVLGGNYLASGTNVWGGAGVRDNGWSLQMATPQQAAPVFPSPVVQVAADAGSALALLADGSVWGAGHNEYRQIAPGTTNMGLAWAAIPGISNAVQVALGDYSGHALLADGSVVSWGKDEDNFGVLGVAGASLLTTPTAVPGLSGITQIYAGDASIYALKSDGTVWGWGAGTQGRLGLGASAAVKNDTPQHIPVPATIVEIVSGRWQAWARDTSGNVWAWGRNNDGGLGVGAAGNDVTSPVKLSGITSAAALGAGIVLLTDGTVVSWSAGQAPSAVSGLTGVQQVCANAVFGGSYYAVTSSGVVAWGKNDAGQLGDGTTNDRSAPVAVTGLNGRSVKKVFTSFRGEKAFFLATT